MPLVWDILHTSMNAEGGQLTWCCITGECGRRSQSAICFGDLSFEAMLKRFILWSFDFGDFSIKVFKIFNEDLFIGDFSYKIYSLEIFPWKFEIFFFFWKVILKIWKKKIYSWRFFVWNMKIFPWGSFKRFFHCNFEKL